MEEAERLCDRIVIIDHGKVVANDTLSGLHRMLPVTNILAIELENPADFGVEQLAAMPEVLSAEVRDDVLRVGVHSLSLGAPRILQWLTEHGHPYQHVMSERPDLETVFLTLTGRSLRDS
jgi:ABC-2 type transport system ATP-binding protein